MLGRGGGGTPKPMNITNQCKNDTNTAPEYSMFFTLLAIIWKKNVPLNQVETAGKGYQGTHLCFCLEQFTKTWAGQGLQRPAVTVKGNVNIIYLICHPG